MLVVPDRYRKRKPTLSATHRSNHDHNTVLLPFPLLSTIIAWSLSLDTRHNTIATSIAVHSTLSLARLATLSDMPAAPASSSGADQATHMSAAKEAKALQAFLTTHAAELEQLPNGKIRCLLTSTDLPARLASLQRYWTGPALARAREAISDAELAEQYPTLQPHKTNKNMLFCTLTRLTLNRRRSHVEAHLRGRRYTKEWDKREERRLAREERERKRREKESGKDDDVEARLPVEVLEDEDEDDDADEVDEQHDEVEDEDEGEEAEEEQQEEQENEDEDDMPILRKVAVPATRKAKGQTGCGGGR